MNLMYFWLESFQKLKLTIPLIGMIAVLVAVGRKEQPADFSGVLIQVVRQPFGSLLLALLTIGLACYGFLVPGPGGPGHRKQGNVFFCDYDTPFVFRSRLGLPRLSMVGVSALTGNR